MTQAAVGSAEPRSPEATARRRAPTRPFRADVDGLRAVAIVLVVAFHAGVPPFTGGFVGVDVFFVISGYLISTILLDETTRSGRIDLLAFWGRRLRRLVPALALMLAVVLGLAVLVLNPLEWQQAAVEGRAAALYVSNVYFAREVADYFADDVGSSLFLHTWSLGVEEQFYVGWPILFALACLLVRRLAGDRATTRRLVVVGGFALVAVASGALALYLTDARPAWAFFSLPSRAWEFAVAGLLAAAPIPAVARRTGVRLACAAVGLAAIVGAAVAFDGSTPWPSSRALVPVLGTLLVIVAGSAGGEGRTNPISTALAARPVQWVGRASYSWYLWHWPLILLAVAWFDDDGLAVTVGASLASLGLAALVHRLVEDPVRFAPALVRSKPRTYAMAGAVTAVVLLGTVGVVRLADAEIGGDDLQSQLAAARTARRAFDCPRTRTTDDGIEYCEAGPADARTTVLLAGDSHARHWVPAFVEVAEEADIRVLVRWRGACPSTNIPVVHKRSSAGADLRAACAEFQRDTDALIDAVEPDLVVLANSTAYVHGPSLEVTDPEARRKAWADDFRARLLELRDRGRVAVVVDTPRFAEDPLDCLAEATHLERCDVPWPDARTPEAHDHAAAEADVAEELGLATLDVNDLLCPDGVCRTHIDGELVYTDREHLHDRFVARLAPNVRAFLEEALAPHAGS